MFIEFGRKYIESKFWPFALYLGSFVMSTAFLCIYMSLISSKKMQYTDEFFTAGIITLSSILNFASLGILGVAIWNGIRRRWAVAVINIVLFFVSWALPLVIISTIILVILSWGAL